MRPSVIYSVVCNFPHIQLFFVRVAQVVSSDLATHKSPLAIVTLLLYQQSSSTTLYYSYQERLSLTEARLRNEAGEITCVSMQSCSSEQSVWSPQPPASQQDTQSWRCVCNMSLNCIWIDLRICWVLDRLATYKSPLAIVTLLFYQQSSSTISPYSYAKVTLQLMDVFLC